MKLSRKQIDERLARKDYNRDNVTVKKRYEKLRRNEVCPCDENAELPSGERKKFKNCCEKKLFSKEQAGFDRMYRMKEIQKARKKVAAAIKEEAEHPIIVPEKKEIIIP